MGGVIVSGRGRGRDYFVWPVVIILCGRVRWLGGSGGGGWVRGGRVVVAGGTLAPVIRSYTAFLIR